MQIAILSGSTRIDRKSHRVALALVAEIEKRGHEADLLDLAEFRFPVFEEVLAKLEEPPEGLVDFSERVKRADAAIFLSPEYNGSYTSALKNAVDFLKESEFARKPIGVATASGGLLGGMRAALNLQELALGVGGFSLPGMLLTPEVGKKFGEKGELLDPFFQPKIDAFLNSFLWLSEAVLDRKQKK